MAITVVSTTPASGVTGHFIDHSIYVQFSKEIEGSYLSSDYFKIYRTNASHTAYYELVASVVTKDGVTVQVNPTGNLRPTEYYMMIVVGGTQGVKDISTDTLAANYIMYWQTASLYNTPPCGAIYVVELVCKWLENLGGLAGMEKLNIEKAQLLYDAIDGSNGYYKNPIPKDCRSRMNVVWRLASEELEAKFLKEASALKMVGLKGHRSVGGCRASIYNACPKESIQALVALMKDFQKANG